MIEEYINSPGDKMFILLAPLDWGLGHATRCIPLINTLQKYRATVVLAAEGPVAKLLKEEFPDIKIIPLAGYRIRYAAGRKSFLLKIIRQLPGLQKIVNQEHKWLAQLLKTHQIDAVISDNRLGISNKKVSSVYITHQLFIETGFSWLNGLAQRLHYKFIRGFNECWVPDFGPAEESLSGKLSHPKNGPGIPVKYIGPLSRFKKEACTVNNEILVLLSGPEPQRTLFENQLLPQLSAMGTNAIVVRGLPGETNQPENFPNLVFHNHLPADQLNSLVQQSNWVIARAGYSTIMDLVSLHKKAILVPTPGQGEQEYLAQYLHEKKLFYTCRQENFSLETALNNARHFSFHLPGVENNCLDKIVAEWLISLRKAKALQ